MIMVASGNVSGFIKAVLKGVKLRTISHDMIAAQLYIAFRFMGIYI